VSDTKPAKPTTKKYHLKRADPLYREFFPEQLYHMTRVGATMHDVAQAFGVTEDKLANWVASRPEMQEAIERGREARNDQVVSALYSRAVGYEHEAEKLFMYRGEVVKGTYKEKFPPDPVAAMYWLKNRQRGQWVDVVRHEHTGKDGGPIELKALVVEAEEATKMIRGLTYDENGKLIEDGDQSVGSTDRAAAEGVGAS
jgi:hypothetical protein